MDESSLNGVKLLGVVFLVLANAFFVASEFALVGVRKSRMEALDREGVRGAKTVISATLDLERYIAGTQLGITLASLALGWIGEEALETLLHRAFRFLPPILIELSAPAIVTFLVITFLHVVLGELVPKSLALQYTDQTALWVARPMRIAVTLLRPLIWALNSTGNLVLRIMGLTPSSASERPVHSIEELKILVDDSHSHGILDAMERSLVNRVFKMKDLVARQVMVHRLDMVAMPVEMPYEGLMLAVVDTPFSRYPVYQGDIDHIVGILMVKDLIGYRRAHQSEPFELKHIVRPPLFVPETATIETVLSQFKRTRMQVAIVVDEFGGTSGMISLQDIIDELIGEFQSKEMELELPHPEAIDWPLVVDGRVRLDVLNERYGLELMDEDADTVSGLLSNYLGRVPRRGEHVVVNSVGITVLEMEGLRITQLSLTPVRTQPEEDEGLQLERTSSPDSALTEHLAPPPQKALTDELLPTAQRLPPAEVLPIEPLSNDDDPDVMSGVAPIDLETGADADGATEGSRREFSDTPPRGWRNDS